METVIQIENLKKSFGAFEAIQDLTFSIRKGEIFGIIGPNGAGKTTTIEIIEGLQECSSGKVTVLGYDPWKDAKKLKENIGVMFQHTNLQSKIKVGEAIELFASFYPRQIDTTLALENLNLEPFRHTYFKNLSGGWKQKLLLTLATLHSPSIVFLDEPSTGLDPKSRRELWKMIVSLRDAGTTIVLTTHYMEEAEQLCDRIAIMNHGSVVGLDTPQKLIQSLNKDKSILIACKQLDIALVQKIAGVSRVVSKNNLLQIFTDNIEWTTFELFKLISTEGLIVDDFRFSTGSLDDLFVKLPQLQEEMMS
ncbi:ABC transporter ATP-binding protein [Lysinibacillus pakistanensis]|uniref:ABC transporter ATP-binding protein n=1 Tax=Lysinibacillus pakistanensis TaxID=759811 RepID=A0AAX3X0D4_9BACI|nr:ABC transporter ATP-binding protein [Lysinibacillus pakistanensis]MDM5233121.1 ABC transporter ATP-binding protein [Lysinibacillus pakistanensis]WHY48605.1 ABC transporter ATP-binding protein [Lysinibacillus pakistanensis]WHY53618.1 ABC transporter ATP-binding protein [Lysinibacillus pakistanensis]